MHLVPCDFSYFHAWKDPDLAISKDYTQRFKQGKHRLDKCINCNEEHFEGDTNGTIRHPNIFFFTLLGLFFLQIYIYWWLFVFFNGRIQIKKKDCSCCTSWVGRNWILNNITSHILISCFFLQQNGCYTRCFKFARKNEEYPWSLLFLFFFHTFDHI